MNNKEEEFGEERLKKIILANRNQNVFAIKEAILKELQSFSNHASPKDDITLVICKHL